MITFFEGLPRSGKSYSAVKEYVIPALEKGRQVVAYVEGLDHEKCAAVAGITVERCRELLHVLTREMVPDIHRIAMKDAVVILDEAQNFWPTGRGKLSPEITQFVAEHGHHGLDILLMGQSIKDVHPLWRRRVERKHYFLKKTALGKPDAYTVAIATAVPKGDDVVFEVIQNVDYEYDKRYFGLYKSHTDGTSNKATLIDERAIIWNRPLFKKWLPIFGMLFVFALGFVVYLFNGGLEKSIAKKGATAQPLAAVKPIAPPLPPGAVRIPDAPDPVAQQAPAKADPVAPLDVVEELNSRGRIRLLGYLRVGTMTKGFIEWRDSANNLLQIFSFHELSGLGWSIMINLEGSVATLTKGPSRIVATAWVLDRSQGRPSETQLRDVRGDAFKPAG